MATLSATVESGRPRADARGQRVLVPVLFAVRRLRAHAQRTIVVAIGIAIGAAVLALTAVGSGSVQDRAVQRGLAQLQPSDRAIQAVWSGVPAQSNLSLARLDSLARNALLPVLRQAPFGVEVFRQATWGGAFVNLGAVDGLSRWLVLQSGRLPRPCTPTDCDLVQIGGAPVAPKLPHLHVVGRATFRAGAPLTAYFGGAGGHRPPILLADGMLRFARVRLPDAALIARTYGWIVPVAPGSIHDWDLASLGARLDRAQASLERSSDIFGVSAPADTLASVRATGRVAGQRLLILGGDSAVLLLGFAVLASTRLRRDHQAVGRRLTWSGARRSQILLVAATEVAGLTLVSSVAGWAAGTGAGALLARHLGSPGLLIVEHSVLTTRAFGIAVALAALTGLVMLAAIRMETLAFGGLSLSVADVAALGALGRSCSHSRAARPMPVRSPRAAVPASCCCCCLGSCSSCSPSPSRGSSHRCCACWSSWGGGRRRRCGSPCSRSPGHRAKCCCPSSSSCSASAWRCSRSPTARPSSRARPSRRGTQCRRLTCSRRIFSGS